MRNLLRIIVAAIFVVSGFVKAVDPVGFSFKLEEYFSPAVFNLPFLEKFALPVAVFVIVLEIVLGLMLLLKIRLKFTIISLILLCVFFAFLTFYSAYFQVVTDCGCFGDAVRFTPWQSFGKDIFLLLLLILLWIFFRKNSDNCVGKLQYFSLIVAVFGIAGVMFIGIYHEPVIDFRDYKIGTDLNSEQKKINDNPSVYKTFYTLKNSKTGQILTVSQDDFVAKPEFWKEGTPWQIIPGQEKSQVVKKGYVSEISKFRPKSLDGKDVSTEILTAPNAILLFSYNPNSADNQILSKTENFLAKLKNVFVLGISTKANTFKEIKNATMDATAIKTIGRSNPFVLTLQNGKITAKESAADFLKNHN